MQLMGELVTVFQNRMQRSAVPPPEATRPCWCGDHAMALTAAWCSEKRMVGTVLLMPQMKSWLSFPPEASSRSSGDHLRPHTCAQGVQQSGPCGFPAPQANLDPPHPPAPHLRAMTCQLVGKVFRGSDVPLQNDPVPAAAGKHVAVPGHGTHPGAVAFHAPRPAAAGPCVRPGGGWCGERCEGALGSSQRDPGYVPQLDLAGAGTDGQVGASLAPADAAHRVHGVLLAGGAEVAQLGDLQRLLLVGAARPRPQ